MNNFFPIFAIVCLFIFGYLSLIICPLTYLLTQNAIHRCSRCLTYLGAKKCFGFPDHLSSPVSIYHKILLLIFLNNLYIQIWHFRLGKCAIVMDRIYAILILIIFSIFSIFYIYSRPYILHHSFFERPSIESRNITNTWD